MDLSMRPFYWPMDRCHSDKFGSSLLHNDAVVLSYISTPNFEMLPKFYLSRPTGFPKLVRCSFLPAANR